MAIYAVTCFTAGENTGTDPYHPNLNKYENRTSMILLGTYNRAGAVTFTGLLLAAAATMLSFHRHLPWAMVCLIGCGICDLLDGWVARRLNRSPAEAVFGLQLDSIVDMATFGVTPVVILLHSGFHEWIDFICFGFYLCAAAMRLAHFNQEQSDASDLLRYYTGLPVTYAALVFPLVVWVSLKANVPFYLWLVRLVVAIMAMLFVCKIKVPKPRGMAYGFFVSLAMGMVLCWIAFGP